MLRRAEVREVGSTVPPIECTIFDISVRTNALRLACTMLIGLGGAGALAISDEAEAVGQVAGRRAWLGVEFESGQGDERGASVTHVVRNSPASAAGLRDADVIVAIDGQTIARPDDVFRAVGQRASGDKLRVTVVRGPGQVQLLASLVPMPASDEMFRLDKIGLPAPSWEGSLSAVSGDVPKNIGQMRGKVIVLDFWATWCLACRMSAPRLSSWQARFGAHGLAVIGITDDPVSDALSGASAFGMRYAVASDESYATQRAFGVRALPTMFVIDKRGVIREVSVGYDRGRDARIEVLLKTLLAETLP
jgi:thiol-disulfide isomerase/thioredoxin